MGTLRDIETVRAARLSGRNVGLVMVKNVGPEIGYVYYIAVAKENRRSGMAMFLLDDAITRFQKAGVKEVFASAETDNTPSEKLFESAGFTRTNFGEVSKRHGTLHTLELYRKMLVVPGEALFRKELTSGSTSQ